MPGHDKPPEPLPPRWPAGWPRPPGSRAPRTRTRKRSADTPLPEERPNVVLIYADDMGWGDPSFRGHPLLHTPHLDQMAEAGLAGLLLMTEPEVRYFSGFHTLFWQSPTRPWFVVVPGDGKPVAVMPKYSSK